MKYQKEMDAIGRDGCCGGYHDDHVGCCKNRIDKFLNRDSQDECGVCERDCQDQPCRSYECPVKLYDACVIYSGTALVRDGVPEGTGLGEVIDLLRRIIGDQESRIGAYHNEVLDLKRIIRDLVGASGGGGNNNQIIEGETW